MWVCEVGAKLNTLYSNSPWSDSHPVLPLPLSQRQGRTPRKSASGHFGDDNNSDYHTDDSYIVFLSALPTYAQYGNSPPTQLLLPRMFRKTSLFIAGETMGRRWGWGCSGRRTTTCRAFVIFWRADVDYSDLAGFSCGVWCDVGGEQILCQPNKWV